MKSRNRRFALGILLAGSLGAGAVLGGPITLIDQQNLSGTQTTSPSFTGGGQSFTPTLSSIDAAEFVFSTSGATLVLKLYNGSGIAGTLLKQSAPITVTTAGFQAVHFDLSTSVALTPGNLYTLFVAATSGTFGQKYNSNNPYASGGAFDQGGSAAGGVDLVFTEGLSIPEPASFLLVVAGLLGLGVRRRTGGRPLALTSLHRP